jgi:Ser/Thr protein kinase RdoA (MazF antagonist)
MGRVTCDVQAADRARLGAVLDGFGLGKVTSARVVAEGLMNRNWAVRTAGGERLFVKQVLDVGREQAVQQHAATRALAALGVPAAAPLTQPDGKTLLDLDGGLYAVYAWVEGSHVPGTRMTAEQAAELGGVLAGLHRGLAQVMGPAAPTVRMKVTDPGKADAAISAYATVIDGKEAHDEFDEYAAAQLRERRALLDTVRGDMPDPDEPWAPAGWVHGDFHDLNVLWDGGRVAAVLDFDRLAVKPYAYEMVRSATLTFCYGDEKGLALDLVAAFASGYRAVLPLTSDQVAFAADRLWWERACDFWQLKRHYATRDSSCDQLFRKASALLWWWTANRDRVIDSLTSLTP